VTQRNLAIRLSVTDAAKVKATLNDVGESGQRALKKVEDASRPASKALLALDGATGTLRGTFDGMTARLGPLGGALSKLGLAGLAAGAALGALTGIIAKGVAMQGEAERSYRRLEAVLNATRHAAGLTSWQITRFAEEMERATLVQAEAVQEAAAVLATFRSVSGETFTRTLRLAQDMATVFGGTLQSSVTQLGKALEDPIQGLTALRRVGISFSASQREVIQALIDTGREAEAQRVILDALEKQVGGAAAAEAGGLTGATNRLADAWGQSLKANRRHTGDRQCGARRAERHGRCDRAYYRLAAGR
jgi:phage-related minor tail protein